MRIVCAFFLAAMASTLTACEADIWAVQDAVRDADAEVASRHAVIAGLVSMPEARLELDRHAVALDADLLHVRSHLSDLDWHCDDWTLDRAWNVLEDIEHRFHLYVGETAVMGGMDELRPACDDYAGDMEGLFSALRRRVDEVWCW